MLKIKTCTAPCYIFMLRTVRRALIDGTPNNFMSSFDVLMKTFWRWTYPISVTMRFCMIESYNIITFTNITNWVWRVRFSATTRHLTNACRWFRHRCALTRYGDPQRQALLSAGEFFILNISINAQVKLLFRLIADFLFGINQDAYALHIIRYFMS